MIKVAYPRMSIGGFLKTLTTDDGTVTRRADYHGSKVIPTRVRKYLLLCDIVNELKWSITKSDLSSYFFYQITDSRVNNTTSMLQSLICLLIN